MSVIYQPNTEPYTHTTELSITKWSPIKDNESYKPYELTPMITFTPDEYFSKVLQRNNGIAKVRIRNTNRRYDGDYWVEQFSEDKFRVFITWEGFPSYEKGEYGTVAVLPKYNMADLPIGIVQAIRLRWIKPKPLIKAEREYINIRPDDIGIFAPMMTNFFPTPSGF